MQIDFIKVFFKNKNIFLSKLHRINPVGINFLSRKLIKIDFLLLE